jgi:hypothetical protein
LGNLAAEAVLIPATMTCRITKWDVQPIEITQLQTAPNGVTYATWTCPVCDWDEHKRGDANYNPARPGTHYTPVNKQNADATNVDAA